MVEGMRIALLFLTLLPSIADAQNVASFRRALNGGTERAMDRWMKHEIHRVRKGHVVTTSSTSYVTHTASFDSLVSFMRRQPGVEDAAWDRCVKKAAIWPGHSTIGVRWRKDGRIIERCWTVQEGIQGQFNLFGWHPHVWKDREHVKYKRARECPGFVDEQRKSCLRSR